MKLLSAICESVIFLLRKGGNPAYELQY